MSRDILRNTWLYQEWIKEAREEGFREGFEKGFREEFDKKFREGFEEARRETLHHILITIVQIRFPKLARITKLLADSTENPEVLDKLIQKMVVAQSIEEAQTALVEVSAENSDV